MRKGWANVTTSAAVRAVPRKRYFRRKLGRVRASDASWATPLAPRIIATTLWRNSVVRYSVGFFVFTLVFAIGDTATAP